VVTEGCSGTAAAAAVEQEQLSALQAQIRTQAELVDAQRRALAELSGRLDTTLRRL